MQDFTTLQSRKIQSKQHCMWETIFHKVSSNNTLYGKKSVKDQTTLYGKNISVKDQTTLYMGKIFS